MLPDDNDPALVAYYEFEGNANDSVGTYHGTVEGDPVSLFDWTASNSMGYKYKDRKGLTDNGYTPQS